MPIVGPPPAGTQPSGYYAGLSATVTATGIAHDGLQIDVSDPALAQLYAMAGGTVRFVPAGGALPTGETSQGGGALVLSVAPLDLRDMKRHLPPGIRPFTVVLYVNVKASTVRVALQPHVEALALRVLQAKWGGAKSQTDRTLLVKGYLDRVMLGEIAVFVPGGAPIGDADLAVAGATASGVRFHLSFLDGTHVDLSPVKHLQAMPSYGGKEWLEHPLITALDGIASSQQGDPKTLPAWAELISMRPSASVQQMVLNRRPLGLSFVHRIEDAHGSINLDYYPVTISKFPLVEGVQSTPKTFLEFVRLHINNFVDPTMASFEPFDEDIDLPRWTSSEPYGALVHIDMNPPLNPLQDGSVVTSRVLPHEWVFSTIFILEDLQHPVSGNRAFGITANTDGTHTFYTRGADRPTDDIDAALEPLMFDAANDLWTSFREGVWGFVNGYGGEAALDQTPVWSQHSWTTISASYWHPTEPWIEE